MSLTTPRLKEIGNRIAGLNYREMKDLAHALRVSIDPPGHSTSVDRVVDALLAFSDDVAKKDVDGKKPGYRSSDDEAEGQRAHTLRVGRFV